MVRDHNKIVMPVVRSDFITDALLNSLDFRKGLFSMLGATDFSMMIKLLGIPVTETEMTKYTNPIRDLHGLAELIPETDLMEYEPVLIGGDVRELTNRIEDPVKYWEKTRSWKKLTMWLDLRHKNPTGNVTFAITLRVITNLVPKLLDVVNHGYSQMEAVLDEDHPTGIMMMNVHLRVSNTLGAGHCNTRLRNGKAINTFFGNDADEAYGSTTRSRVVDLNVFTCAIDGRLNTWMMNLTDTMQPIVEIQSTKFGDDVESLNASEADVGDALDLLSDTRTVAAIKFPWDYAILPGGAVGRERCAYILIWWEKTQ